MSRKPFELTVHESYSVQDGPDVTKVYLNTEYGRAVYDFRADQISQHKRLTDVELAAEHWRAKYSGVMAEKYGGLDDVNRAKIATVERFYNLPHYDQETP